MCLGKDFDAPKVYAFGSDCPQFALAVGILLAQFLPWF
jgi:hypothetical protein